MSKQILMSTYRAINFVDCPNGHGKKGENCPGEKGIVCAARRAMFVISNPGQMVTVDEKWQEVKRNVKSVQR